MKCALHNSTVTIVLVLVLVVLQQWKSELAVGTSRNVSSSTRDSLQNTVTVFLDVIHCPAYI